MKRNLNILFGLLLIGGGTLLLLQNLGYLKDVSGYLWALVLSLFGLGFLVGYALDRSHWWALIPGIVLLSIGVVVGLSTWNAPRFDSWGGPLVLGGVALSFWTVYLARREFWWALIPAGVLTSLAAIAILSDRESSSSLSGAVFFFGLAITFVLVLLATRMRWAIFAAAALALVGVFILVGQARFINFLWPVVIIAVGAFLLFRVWRPVKR